MSKDEQVLLLNFVFHFSVKVGLLFLITPNPACNLANPDSARLPLDMQEQCDLVDNMVDIMYEFEISCIPIMQLDQEKRIKLVLNNVAKYRFDLLTESAKKLLNIF